MIKQKTFDFELSEKLRYSHDGTFGDGKSLTLHSPSRANLKISRKLEQIITSTFMKWGSKISASADAINKLKEEKEEEEDALLDAKLILSVIYASDSPIDIFYYNFRELMCTQCCRIDDKAHLTKDLYDKIDPEDEKRLAGEYCAFFLQPSLPS